MALLADGCKELLEMLLAVSCELGEDLLEFLAGVAREGIFHAGLGHGPVQEAAGAGVEAVTLQSRLQAACQGGKRVG